MQEKNLKTINYILKYPLQVPHDKRYMDFEDLLSDYIISSHDGIC